VVFDRDDNRVGKILADGTLALDQAKNELWTGSNAQTDTPGAGSAPAELAVVATVGFTPHWLELFTSQLERVGTRCVVRQLPFPALGRALQQGSFEAALIGFPATRIPIACCSTHSTARVEATTRA
jgi:hypothetical protein